MLQTPRQPTENMLHTGMVAMRSVPKLGARRSTAKVVWLAMETQRLIDDELERIAAVLARLDENMPWASPGVSLVRVEPIPAIPVPQPRQDAPSTAEAIETIHNMSTNEPGETVGSLLASLNAYKP